MTKMKKLFCLKIILVSFLIICFMVIACSGSETANENKAISNKTNETEIPLKFQKGETVTYKLIAIIGHVGNQTIEVLDIMDYEGVKCYYVKSLTSLIPEIEKQFSYDYEDVIYSYIDSSTMLPVKVIKEVKQGNYEDNVEITFDHINKEGVYISTRKHPDGKQFTWECDELLYLLSAIYNVRAKTIEIGDEFSINLLDEKTFTVVEGKVKAVEGEPYKSIPTIQLKQLGENKNVNSITMRLINNKKNWLPVNITIGVMKIGDLVLTIDGAISSYKGKD